MPKFKDKDEFFDKLYDHVFPESEGDPSDEDIAWFEHLTSFFDDPSGNDGGNNQGTNPPRRRRSSSGSSSSGTPRRRSRQSASSGYGNSAWFGN